ncbi:xanthine dehydrogenase small subunit [Pseudomaricurvus alkylphenolicus]|uniref:xanthine dehydrogenase small subunit n=1 Tax=Pseudomaricurvus alkylphenolicus TaxID=1306991 RepID=UPI0014245313|nr:xanthine dehydrogenase small subunit [Pseudomaricurvus alkylphenolicus]NIB40946.1 xanthine dehydrogenase small subunit [Pseudomaricurvus alkylphenolicus]
MADKSIRFLLNNTVRTLTDCNPNTSILQFLRAEEKRSGTKEGCCSGDCGACTVVIAELVNGDLRYKSLNACIGLMPSLHGKQLITVEDLKDGDRLHPVQQAMVDHHGSQCGFCTPGFVMSLFALHKNFPNPDQHQTLEALAGNLCRCTGYRAILDAAKAAANHGPDQFDRNKAYTTATLQAIHADSIRELTDGEHSAFAPNTVEELASLLQQHPQARLLAGGTDLALEITQQLKQLETLIYVGNVEELQIFEETDQGFTIGAALPYSEFTPRLAAEYPDFGDMIERLGSLQIRNHGTLGGNIGNASPIGDTPPVLIALGATITLRRGQQERTIPAEDYFVDYKVTDQREHEFIRSVFIPKAKADHALKIYKISKRLDDDISAVLGVFHINVKDGVIETSDVAYGGMAAIPKRASNCEAALKGQAWNTATIENAMQALENDFSPLSDVRASADYRMQVAKNLLKKCYLELDQPQANSRVVNYFDGGFISQKGATSHA